MQNLSVGTLTSFLWNNFPTLLKGAYRRSVNGLPYAFSFNIADRCPIGCSCYWKAQARVTELTNDEVVAFFEQKRREGYLTANLIGGEPYVRPELLTRVAGIIPFNWVVTSGTTPLRRLKNTTHWISIDGADSETHDRVRKSKGLYDRIVKNLTKARATGDFPAFIHTTLNALSYKEIGRIIEVWSANGLVDGILISTLTPIKDSGDDEFRLSREQRVWVVDELLRLKKEFPDFICMTEPMIRRLHPDHTSKLTPAICDTAKWIESYDAAGKRMPQCILSEKADCSECGCVITTMSDSTQEASLSCMTETARTMSKLFTLR